LALTRGNIGTKYKSEMHSSIRPLSLPRAVDNTFMSDASSPSTASEALPEERTNLYWVAKNVGAVEPR
jgi:hypothetical protein